MKVLDIISESFRGDAAEYVWKYFGKSTPKHAVARETVEEIAVKLFNDYGKRGIEPPRGIVGDMLERHPSAAGLDDATKNLVKIEISRYYRDLEKKFASSRLPGKAGATVGADAVAAAGTAWGKMKTIGLCNIAFGAYALKDIWDIVHFYHENMQRAFGLLEKGQRGEPGGIDLEDFHVYHKDQLTTLFAQLIVIPPQSLTKAVSWVPILGWALQILNTGPGRLAWISFINAKVFDGPNGRMSVRNYIDNFCLWNIQAIPLIGPFLPDRTISDIVGDKLKWGEDVVKEAWVNWLQNTFYKDKEIPEKWLPPGYVGPDPSNPADKKKYAPPVAPNAAKVTTDPASVDSQAETNPSKNNGTASSDLDKNWKDLGNGFDAHVHTGAIRVNPGPNKK